MLFAWSDDNIGFALDLVKRGIEVFMTDFSPFGVKLSNNSFGLSSFKKMYLFTHS